jgi:hypothetical protein
VLERTAPVARKNPRRAVARQLLALCVTVLGLLAPQLAAAQRTICTITVNSEDEKNVFKRHFPKDRFVELVERGRPDWLESACHAGVTCDVLILSAHFDGDNAFFSDKLEVNEHLTVEGLERASCSGACPGWFSKLKDVYLFGCNTLDPDPQNGASAEVLRSLLRSGQSRQEANTRLSGLTGIHAQSSRDRMRLIFKDVPAIYGFRSVAPLGPVAGSVLDNYFRNAGVREIGKGRPNARLLRAFSDHGLTVAAGVAGPGPLAHARADMCQFADPRQGTVAKLKFVHELFQRHIGEARLQLDRIQRLTSSLDDATRREPGVAQVLQQIRRDAEAGTRLLGYARATEPPVRVRLLAVAQDLGWLAPADHHAELAAMLRQMHARSDIGISDVDLACSLNRERRLDGVLDVRADSAMPTDVGHAALRACLGSGQDRSRTLQALLAPQPFDARLAQVYLRHRPVTEAKELRDLTEAITAMPAGPIQVRALETLARHYVGDREVLHDLLDLFSTTPSSAVQSAIAGVLIRADRRTLQDAQLATVLSQHRRPAPGGGDGLIDALIRTVQPH